MKIKLHVIGSGSKGNATIISDGNTNILVDLGVTKERFIEGLNEINLSLKDINYAFFTHDHIDHIRNHEMIDESKRYALKDTIKVDKNHTLAAFKEYEFDTFKVMPIATSHDAKSPCGYIFTSGEDKLVYITDTGIINLKTFNKMKNADIYFIESNYDELMLINSGRPLFLIDRIASEHGHLSNVQSATYMAKLISVKTKKIILGHISEDCNTPDIALYTHKKIYEEYGLDVSNIDLLCAKQWESVDL